MINRRKLLALSIAPAAIPLAKMLPEPKPDIGPPTFDVVSFDPGPLTHSANWWTPPRQGVWQVTINTPESIEYVSLNDETGLISLPTNTPIRIG